MTAFQLRPRRHDRRVSRMAVGKRAILSVVEELSTEAWSLSLSKCPCFDSLRIQPMQGAQIRSLTDQALAPDVYASSDAHLYTV